MGSYYQERDGSTPPVPFTTDGCSGGMSWFWQIFVKPFTKTDIPWRKCCVAHDREYWYGGTWKQRKEADTILKNCVKHNGYPFMAWAMYWGVRIGGSPYWPFGWSWGYGHRRKIFWIFSKRTDC